MTPREAVGWVLILAAAICAAAELVKPQPVGLLLVAGLVLFIAGAALICDGRQPQLSEQHGDD